MGLTIKAEDQIRIAEEGVRLTKVMQSMKYWKRNKNRNKRKRDSGFYTVRLGKFDEFQKYFDKKIKNLKADMEKIKTHETNKGIITYFKEYLGIG